MEKELCAVPGLGHLCFYPFQFLDCVEGARVSWTIQGRGYTKSESNNVQCKEKILVRMDGMTSVLLSLGLCDSQQCDAYDGCDEKWGETSEHHSKVCFVGNDQQNKGIEIRKCDKTGLLYIIPWKSQSHSL